MQKSAKEWVDMIHALKVPVGVINSIEDALAEPQIVHRNLVVNIPHRLNENFQTIGSPIKLSDTPVEYHHAPPELGEHTAQILSRFKTAEELAALKRKALLMEKLLKLLPFSICPFNYHCS